MLLCLTVGLSTFAILLSKSLVLALGYGTDCTFILMILVSFTLKKKKKKLKIETSLPIWAYFFFGRTFDLVSGQQRICACEVPHPLFTLTLEKDVFNMIEQTTIKKTAVRKRATPQVIFSNEELQLVTTTYVLLVNREQDWKASDCCSISVVSSRKLAKDNHDNASYSPF